MIAGVDEVGRGPLAGPVVAAAVILPEPCLIMGLADSKTLTEKKRKQLSLQIKAQALAYCIIEVSPAKIDEINILQASLLAMREAIFGLKVKPLKVLIDGNKTPQGLEAYETQAIVGGDATVPCISAASIIAKVYRDALMHEWDAKYPGYGFAKHKGYGTAQHLVALEALGPCAIHRRSFAPVKRSLGY